MRFAGSVSCFTSRSIAIDRARRSSPVVRAICQRSIGSVSTASKRRHMAWCCVCMQVNETGHAQRLNTLKQRPRKWFFREEVDFLSSLIDLQQVQAERFSFLLEVTCALAPGPGGPHGFNSVCVCVCVSACVSGIKLLSHHATNRDQVGFCRQVSTR